jgi:hypothetical protein
MYTKGFETGDSRSRSLRARSGWCQLLSASGMPIGGWKQSGIGRKLTARYTELRSTARMGVLWPKIGILAL